MRKRLACRPLQASPAVIGQTSPFHGRKRPNPAHLDDRRGPGTRRQPQKPTILAHELDKKRYANVRVWPFSLLISSQGTLRGQHRCSELPGQPASGSGKNWSRCAGDRAFHSSRSTLRCGAAGIFGIWVMVRPVSAVPGGLRCSLRGASAAF